MDREKKQLVAHAGIYLLARGLPGLITFCAIPLFTRLLEPSEYGRYALVMATVLLINALVFQWLRLGLVRYLPVYRDESQRLKSTLVTVSVGLLVALGAIAFLACLTPWAAPWRSIIAVVWVTVAAQSLFEQCCENIRATLRPWNYMVMQVGKSVVMLALGYALIRFGFGWFGPVLGTVAGMGIGVVWAWRRDWSDAKLIIDRKILSQLCIYGIPLSLTVGLAVVVYASDRFLIAYFLGDDAAGVYSVAVDLTSQTLTLLMLVVSMAAFPAAVRAFESSGEAAAQKHMAANVSLLLAIGLPCVVGLGILAPSVANNLLGANFRAPAIAIIPFVAIGAFLAGLKAYHFDAAFQFAHRTIHQVWIVLCVAIINIVLNAIAIPRWGINGAACATASAYVISIGLTALFGRRYFRLPFPLTEALQIAGAALAMGMVLYQFRDHHSVGAFAAQIIGGAAIYGVTLFAMNFMKLRDIAIEKLRAKSSSATPAAATSLVENGMGN